MLFSRGLQAVLSPAAVRDPPFSVSPWGATVLQPSPGCHAQASAMAPRLVPAAGPPDQAQPVSAGQCAGGYPQGPLVPLRGRSNAAGGTSHLCVFFQSVPPAPAVCPLHHLRLLYWASSALVRVLLGCLVRPAVLRTPASVSGSLAASSGCRHLAHSLPLVCRALHHHRAIKDPRSMAHKGCQGFHHSFQAISGENRAPGRQDY
ncbi:hypothetical protein NDU88_002324 [Pleurodeles waltl]|uniref:Uncharacterized protein n=1 Tax=Pleurodeles waltl TaxID=8319 RepID=A0AAV7WPM4_PLEWA|nr:hypothetical protein NDU88_002324 [Pleurodeles waltl]